LAGLRAMMAVADSLVEYQDQRGHRVLDGRPAELGLPLVDRAVDQACGDHPVRKMTERRNDAKSGAGGRARSTYRLGEFGKYCDWNPGVEPLACVEGEPQISSV